MEYIQGADRKELTLFPGCIDDYITPDNAVRVIDAFVDSLDMEQLEFEKAVLAHTGRPPYNPKDLLKLYIYGYMNKIRSSRKLEEEAGKNIELMWLLKKLIPDFKTIADFRKDNKKAINNVFKQFTLLCKEWDLFGMKVVAVDGTKIRAYNSKHNNFSVKKLDRRIKYIEKKIEDHMKSLDDNDAQETSERKPDAEEIKKRVEELSKRKEVYEGYKEEIKEKKIGEISKTDPDARLMASNNNGIDVSYNVQTVVDSKHCLIVDCEVINNPTDHGQLNVMSKRAKEIFEVDSLESLADMGYYSTNDLKACDEAGIITYVPKQRFSNSTGVEEFYADKFKYDKQEDVFICPAGQELQCGRMRTIDDTQKREYKNYSACKDCEYKSKCTKSNKGRTVTRDLDQDFLDKIDERTKANKELRSKRKEIVEHPYGTIKRNWGFTYFLVKGLESVRTEVFLSFLAYNMKRVMNIMGIQEVKERLAVA